MKESYSVLMSVYYKESPKHLQKAMMSIYNQTISTNDFVLVCDGPLTDELNTIIQNMKELFGERLNVVRLADNLGLGKALNIGLNYCKNELVARMDSDDISYKDRCERQLNIFGRQPELSICSGNVEEFSESINKIDARRVLPEKQSEILEFAKKRNPFNHPCVMYKKSAVESVGGYRDFYLLEDYYLWLRMLLNGKQGYNIQEPLLYMRAGSEMYKRRSGWKYAKAQRELFGFMLKQHFITKGQYVKSVLLRSVSSLAPNCLRKFMFEKILRK